MKIRVVFLVGDERSKLSIATPALAVQSTMHELSWKLLRGISFHFIEVWIHGF